MSDHPIVKKASNLSAEVRGGRTASRNSSGRQLHHQVLEIINHFLFSAENGYLILTIQDGCVVKIEKTEKYIITTKNRGTGYIKYGKPVSEHPLQPQIISELQKIQYGQLVIRFANGKIEQIEKTEKRRVNEVEGINGDGI
ncbi:hypothetical protein P22_3185 [Propionispora sp. 2/2-37]|uniref:DUF2292 domain-containing protein n=1 Tax=Propionispora sp. 2/2-37 TaxID=1677858 RepID=UPI0006C4272F|nr:DUF2292 domain-containing protein [Propionispora sp. 2/2-37]CUH97059.1 hypothetical protein P22_3185 [Propionispora sp. 2/2-37]